MSRSEENYRIVKLKCARCGHQEIVDSRTAKANQMLSWNGWLDLTKPAPGDPLGQIDRLLCPSCAKSFDHFMENGREDK